MHIKKKIYSSKMIVGNFNIPLPMRGRSCRQKINKETAELNDTK
jgi:hypothetical protein